MSRKDTASQGRKAERGSIFTVLLGAVALTAVVGVTAFQTLSGPVMTAVRVKNKTLAETEMLAAAKITLVDAVNQAGSGDCDGDTFIEPVAWRAGSGPANAGLMPLTIGAPTTDPWGTSYGYCVWDVGPTSDDAACGGPGALRLNGSDTPLAGNADTQTVMAIVSAGPDRQFQTSCINYVDATTSVVTKGGDDLVLKYTYVEAGSAADGLWSVKSSDPDVATTTKDVEVGSFLQIDNASGQLWAGGGVELGDESLVTICDGTNVGLMRYNTAEAAVEVCDGADWVELESNGGGVTNGLVGYWKLDDGAGATAADSSGNGNDGTLNGPSWASGPFDGALSFDSVNDRVDVANETNFDFERTDAFSIALWVNHNDASLPCMVCKILNGVNFPGIKFYVDATNDGLGFGLTGSDGSKIEVITASGTLADNMWHHVAVTYDGSSTAAGVQLYINGTNTAFTTNFDTLAASILNNTQLRFGNNQGDAAYFGGRLDDIRFYDRELAADEITTLSGAISRLDDLADAYTDYGASRNMIIGREDASALTSGAQYNTFIGENAGAISASSTAATDYNTAVGHSTLAALTSGGNNTAVGYSALIDNMTGGSSVAMGASALRDNSTGSLHIAVGASALQSSTIGNFNIAVGGNALWSLTNASRAVAVGYNALYNDTASYSTAVGYQALFENKARMINTAIGYDAMRYADSTTTVGDGRNTAVGYQALRGSTTAASNTGMENTAAGADALVSNTSGNGNTALGYNALASNQTAGHSTAVGANALALSNGSNNVAVGNVALGVSTSGAQNTAVGASALAGVQTGNNNTALGYNAGNTTTTGSGNILIGAGVTAPAIGTSNHLNIGNTIYGDLSNGYVGIGTVAPDKKLHIAGDLDDDGVKLESFNGTDAGGPQLQFLKSKGETSTTKTIVANGDEIGHLFFQSYDGSTYRSVAHIVGNVDATPGAGDTPSRFTFSTTADGAATSTIRMSIRNGGDVGLGTTSPAELLHLAGNDEKGIRIDVATSGSSDHNPFVRLNRSRGTIAAPTLVSSGDNLGELHFWGYDGSAFLHSALIELRVDGTSGASDMPTRLEFHVQPDGSGGWMGDSSGTAEMVIKNDGKIGMGTESPDSLLHVYDDGTDAYYEALKVEGEGEPAVILNAASSTAWLNPIITTVRSRGTLAAPTIVGSSDSLLELLMMGYDGSAYRDAAYIAVLVDGTPGANDMPGRLEFHTQADGSGGALESTTPEMVIKNNGAIGIGTATPNEGKVEVKGGSVCVDTNSDDTASSCITTESDERLKKNVKPITNALEKVLKIRGVEFDWRWDEFDIASKWKNQPHGIGVIAQEVEKVFPEAMGEEDQGFKTVEYRYLVAPLIEAVRELREQGRELDKTVARLEKELSQLEAMEAEASAAKP